MVDLTSETPGKGDLSGKPPFTENAVRGDRVSEWTTDDGQE